LQVVDPHYVMSIEVHMVIILVPLIAFNLIPNLKVLAPFSALANVLTFVGLGIVVYYLLAGERSSEPLDLWGSPHTFPLFFGTVLFALTAVGVVSPSLCSAPVATVAAARAALRHFFNTPLYFLIAVAMMLFATVLDLIGYLFVCLAYN
jgi:hypothetical protein